MRREFQLSLFPSLVANDNSTPAPRSSPRRGDEATPSVDDELVRRSVILAIQERRVCRIRYTPDGKSPRTREFEPYAITRVDKHWSVFGFCRLRGDLRTFRSDRITSFEVLESCFVPRESMSLERFILRRRGVA